MTMLTFKPSWWDIFGEQQQETDLDNNLHYVTSENNGETLSGLTIAKCMNWKLKTK